MKKATALIAALGVTWALAACGQSQSAVDYCIQEGNKLLAEFPQYMATADSVEIRRAECAKAAPTKESVDAWISVARWMMEEGL